MTKLVLHTHIKAPIELCFDLARSIDVHKISAGKTRETAIRGRTQGLAMNGDHITWEATHFFVRQELTVKMTGFARPYYFSDSMVKGAFVSLHHIHRFQEVDSGTIMTDQFEYQVPYGLLGRLFDTLVLKRYLSHFLRKRNQILKNTAESIGTHWMRSADSHVF